MIQINLLPQEELKSVSFKRKKIPIIPFLIVILLILLLYWITQIFSITVMKAKIYEHNKSLKTIIPQKSDVDTVYRELHDSILIKKGYVEDIVLNKISWAQVLNVISDYTSQGIWLYRLDIEKKDEAWLITIGGFAKPITSRSMIKDIGNYITDIKETLEVGLIDPSHAGDAAQDKIEVSTVTSRKQAGQMELTEFVSNFKIIL